MRCSLPGADDPAFPAAWRAALAALSPAERRAGLAWVWEGDAPPPCAEGPLRGLPFAVKDLFDVAGLPTLAGSTFLREVWGLPLRDAALVRDFRRLGAFPVAKTQLQEFAAGTEGSNAHYGTVLNPRYPAAELRLAGGSSSGSAWAVAAGLVPCALGSDTGGSIRVPAAWCGLFGWRAPRRDWSDDGAVPLAPAFDTGGWFTADGPAMARLLETVGEICPHPGRSYNLLYAGVFEELVDPEHRGACAAAAARLGAVRDPVAERVLREACADAVEAYGILVAEQARAFHGPLLERFGARYDPLVRRRLEGWRGLTPEHGAAARRITAMVDGTIGEALTEYDGLVLPAVPFPAPRAEAYSEVSRRRLFALTTPASLARAPVLTLPFAAAGEPAGLALQVLFGDAHHPAAVALARGWPGTVA